MSRMKVKLPLDRRSEPVAVAKVWDDLYVGVKGLSRRVIAGSLRKIFKYCGSL